MPKAVVDENLADEVVDLDDMAESITANLFK
jgi:two-component system chemotaxis response regulator CheB